MPCPACASLNIQPQLEVEMVVHFSEFKFFKHPGVPLVLPLSVCLDCGHAVFTISKSPLDLLRDGPRSDASDSPQGGATAVKNSAGA
jgi:hypothetical protein